MNQKELGANRREPEGDFGVQRFARPDQWERASSDAGGGPLHSVRQSCERWVPHTDNVHTERVGVHQRRVPEEAEVSDQAEKQEAG